MAKQDRHERHLMRQRGAGSRALLPTFGFTFGASSKITKSSKPAPTPAKSKTPARHVHSTRRKSTIYRTPSRRATLAAGSPTSPSARSKSVKGATKTKESAKEIEERSEPLPDLEADEIAPPPSASPVRKAKFYEHLDEDIPAAPIKETKRSRKGSTRKRKTVTMPRKKRAPAKKAVQVNGEPQEVVDERAELEKAGLLGPSGPPSPLGSRKRKQVVALETNGLTRSNTVKKARLHKQPSVSETLRQAAKSVMTGTPKAKRSLAITGKETVAVKTPNHQRQSPHAFKKAVQEAKGSPAHFLGKLRSPSKSTLRGTLGVEDELSGGSARKPEIAELDPLARQDSNGAMTVGKSPSKASSKASKVSKARRMFRIRDADDSGEESWFRPRKKR